MLGPTVSIFSKILKHQDGPDVSRKFFFVREGNGSDLPEMRQGFPSPVIHIEGESGPAITHQT